MTREIVFVNGWGMTRAVWAPLRAALPSASHAQTIDLCELPVGEMTHAAAALAERAPGPCHVVAWSLGAQLALQWAHDRPEQVQSLALIAATPCFVARSDWDAGMAREVFEAFAAQVASDADGALARFALLQARGEGDMSGVARVLKSAVQCDAAATARASLEAGLEWLRTSDVRPLLAAVAQPVYLAHGAQDAVVPVAAAEHLARALRQARLDVIRDAGHAPHVSRPAELAAPIAEFLHER